MVEPTINGMPIRLELDTGSALSIIPDCQYRHHLSRLLLSPISVVLKVTAVNASNRPGVIFVDVQYNSQHHDGKALIVTTDGPPLFGRDWLQHIRIDWSHVHRLTSRTASAQRHLDELLERYSADRGRFRHCKGHLHPVDGAKHRLLKVRLLPYTIRMKVTMVEGHNGARSPRERRHPWSIGVNRPPQSSRSPRTAGSARLCGDCKDSLNNQLKVDQFPLPRADDVFA